LVVFNAIARIQDDHVKNIAFLMNRCGEWSLSPPSTSSTPITPKARWTRVHQMSINGKRDDFTIADLDQVASVAGLKERAARRILTDVTEAVDRWPDFATAASIPPDTTAQIRANHRLHLATR
jgi:serine/threonine-protein kinase HipA